MSLSSAGATATRSLGVLSDQINITSRNVSGAGVAGVSAKRAIIEPDESGVAFLGVGRAADAALFRNLINASAQQETAKTVSDSLSRIDLALNLSDTANSRSPATLISKLRSALQTYSATPENQVAAQVAMTAAKDVVQSLKDATAATQQERRVADSGISAAVTDLNDLLTKFGDYNAKIIEGSSTGADVTDMLDARDEVLSKIAKIVGVTTVTRPNNDMVLYTDSGVTLFETTPRRLTFQPSANFAPGSVGSPVYIDGVQVTGPSAPLALRSGSILGLTQVRDDIAPVFQNQLDEIARGLIVSFSESDQTGGGGPDRPGLFTSIDPNTLAEAQTVPGATLAPGLASRLTLSAASDPTPANPSPLRDGVNYSYNPTHASGYADRLISLTNASAKIQDFDPAAALGATGSVQSMAAASNGWIAAARQQIENSTTYFDAVVAQTTQALSNATGINLDTQMSHMLELENSYQASAKLLQAVDAMFNALISAIKA